MMEQKEEGISLGEIFRVIFKKKWLLLGVTVVIMLIGVIIVQAFYNPSKEQYHVDFELEFPNRENGLFPDGKKVLYAEFISYENLEKAKSKDESFSSIDVAKMLEKNDIDIKEETIVLSNGERVSTGKYTITVLKKYFTSSEQAANYMKALAYLPIDYALTTSVKIRYDYNLQQALGSGDFASQVDCLIAQRDLLLNGYDHLMEKYTNGYTLTKDEKSQTLSEAKSEVQSYFSKNSLTALKTETELNGYLKTNSDFKDSIQQMVNNLDRELKLNTNKIKALEDEVQKLAEILKGSTSTDNAFESMLQEISKLIQRNEEIKHLKDDVYGVYLNNPSDSQYEQNLKVFQSKLDKHYNMLLEFTNTYRLFNIDIYNTNSRCLFQAGSIVIEDGGINLLLAVVAFLVLGLIIGCCLNLVIDMPKYLREKKNGKLQASKETPSEEEASVE